MSDISKINNGSETYNIKDATARSLANNAQTTANNAQTTANNSVKRVETAIDAIKRDSNTSALAITGGSVNATMANNGDGARLILFGKGYSSKPGAFEIRTNDGTNEFVLSGSGDGALKWSGSSVSGSAFAEAFLQDGTCVSETVDENNKFTASYTGLCLIKFKNSDSAQCSYVEVWAGAPYRLISVAGNSYVNFHAVPVRKNKVYTITGVNYTISSVATYKSISA